MEGCRFLIVTFPGQGHISPALQFAKHLPEKGAKVTFLTGSIATRHVTENTPKNISILPFSEGCDNDYIKEEDVLSFMTSLVARGSQALTELIKAKANEGQPFTHVVYTTFMSWVGRITHELQIPSTLLWIRPAALLEIYYYYFNGYRDVTVNSDAIELPGLPLLTSQDLPSFLLASSPAIYNISLPAMKEEFEYIGKKENPEVLVNIFHALELEALKSIKHFKMIGIGPLIPSAFLDGKDPSDNSFGGDLHKRSAVNYVEWLNSKPDASVVYVAFGSFSDLSMKQMEVIARGLRQSQKPILWVIRPTRRGEKLVLKIV